MNICLVGDFSPDLDEGYKNTGHYLARELEKRHTVIRVNVKKLQYAKVASEIRQLRPQIIHTIAQPTNQSFAFTFILNRLWPTASTVISTLRPDRYFKRGRITQGQRRLLQFIKPDLVLTQTEQATLLFEQMRCSVASLSNGVDLQRFKPVDAEQKSQLRRKYNLDQQQPVVLHVGHLAPARNLFALAKLPQASIQVVIAGSLYMGINHTLIEQLKSAGYHVLEGYQPNVDELYKLADCYVFPVKPGESIAMPLSVLEAMACNLPVITTCFSGLVDAFDEGDGLQFIEPDADILSIVQNTLGKKLEPRTREMVQKFSWETVTNQLETHYLKICKQS